MLHPIGFSIPEEKLVPSIPTKTKLLATSIPRDLKTYIYTNENEYYDDYKQSYFAITTKKAGWDCMRHYEILANGCLPFFPSIDKCPDTILTLFPKELVNKSNNLFNKMRYSINNKIVYTIFNDDTINPRLIKQLKTTTIRTLDTKLINEFNTLISEFLEYTRAKLTTQKLATYMLEKSGKQSASKILFLSGNTDPDYLRCLILHGLKQIRGTNCHDFPKVAHLYKTSRIDYSKLYGNGISYSNVLEQSLHDDTHDLNVEEHIKKKVYDLIIYGSYHRGMPKYDLVMEYYKPDDVLLLCGEDIHECNYKEWVNKGHCVFVRELE